MKGTPAIYLGRIVEKKNFRAFIYGVNGQRRLVNSWEEFEANMQSGLWFASVEDAEASKVVEEPESEHTMTIDELPEQGHAKPRSKPQAKPKPKPQAKPQPKPAPVKEVEDAEDVLPDDGSVFEVTDDFLPNEGK